MTNLPTPIQHKLLAGSKFLDFLIGCAGPYVIGIAFSYLLGLFFPLTESLGGQTMNTIMGFVSIGGLVAWTVVLVQSWKKDYRWIAYGMLATLLVPLLIFGACLLILLPQLKNV